MVRLRGRLRVKTQAEAQKRYAFLRDACLRNAFSRDTF